jgi:hypothetical protein
VKLLFVLRHPTAVRSLHGVFRLLAEHGHDVHLGFAAAKSGEGYTARHPTAVRSLHGVFRLLAEHGHDVHLGFAAAKSGVGYTLFI